MAITELFLVVCVIGIFTLISWLISCALDRIAKGKH